MRIRIVGNGLEEIFPLNYRVMIISMIKRSIEISDKEYFKELYFYEGKKNKKIKPFSFGVYFRDYIIKGDIVQVNGDISIIISTPDYNFGIALYNGLLRMEEYIFNKYTFIKKKVSLEKESVVNSNKIILKTLSPIHIKDKNNKPIDIKSEEYSKELNYISNIILKTYRGYGLKEELEFTSIAMKKMVIKEKIKGFIENNNKEYIYINGYSGIFTLKGDVEDLQLLMQLGIGFRRSEGFGLIDLA